MKWRIGDFIVIGVVLIFALAIWLYPALSATGDFATISQNGKEDRISLHLDREIELENAVVSVKDGTIAITHADCPDLVCVNTGAISRKGQSIVCVPNQIIITIGENLSVDAISN